MMHYHVTRRRVELLLFSLLVSLHACTSAANTRDEQSLPDSATAVQPRIDTQIKGNPAGDVSVRAIDTASATQTPANDTVIANVIVSAHRGEIETGRLAIEKSRDARVQTYARSMIQAHQRELTKILRVMSSAGMRAADSTITVAQATPSADLVMQAMVSQRQTMEALRAATGTEFERTYLDVQVAGHRLLQQTLQQNEVTAQSVGLAKHVQSLKSMIRVHLQRATTLQQSLAANAATGL
jgi:putative membrane protein